MHKPVLCFWSPYQNKEVEPGAAVLSNWYPAPTRATFNKTAYRFATSEHHFMAIKALTFGDLQSFNALRLSTDPKEAKTIGGQVKGFDEDIWAMMRYDAMLEACRAKFLHQDSWKLRSYLAATAPRVLAEASPYDLIWGIGLDKTNELCQNPKNWRGQNMLGKVLMQVRSELRGNEYSI